MAFLLFYLVIKMIHRRVAENTEKFILFICPDDIGTDRKTSEASLHLMVL